MLRYSNIILVGVIDVVSPVREYGIKVDQW